MAVRSLKRAHACGLLRKQLNTHIYDFIAFESRGTAVDNNHLLAQRQQTTARTFLLQSHQPWLNMIDWEVTYSASSISPVGGEKKMQFRFQHFCNPSEPPIKFALLCGKGLKILWAPKHSIQKLSTTAWFVVRQQLECIACHITQSSEFSLISNTCWQLKIAVGNTCHSCVRPLF